VPVNGCLPPAFFRQALVPHCKISDCGMVIEIERRRFSIEPLITLDPSYSRII
jgi:hypothetical protein